ncbi:hypothetical protein [Streptomyces sp. NBC_01257]|nr:hypothetical protein [Streptomyces sp. NBC_01257]WRZ64794.1 hypothetical protein OG408_13255 [Streptomyces sp. NBC_01257]
MPASRHEVPDLPFVRRARDGAGSSPAAVRTPGGDAGTRHSCTARGRSRS